MRRTLLVAVFLSLLASGVAQAGSLLSVWQKAFPPKVYADPNAVLIAGGDGRCLVVFPATTVRTLFAVSAGGDKAFECRTAGEVTSAPAVADIDSDGKAEIIAATDAGARSELYCFSSDGQERWRTPLLAAVQWSNAVPAELDGQPPLEIVVTSVAGLVQAFDAQGWLLWVFQCGATEDLATPGVNEQAPPETATGVNWDIGGPSAVGDCNADGATEILFPSGSGYLYCLDATGGLLWKARLGKETITGPMIIPSAEGAPSVVGCSVDGRLVCLDGATGQERWSLKLEGEWDSTLAVADLEGDGRLEIVLCNTSFSADCVSEKGELLWRAPLTGGAFAAPAIADLDADGRAEVIFGTRSARLEVFDSAGAPWASLDMPSAVYNSPLVADVDADGRLDILVACRQGQVCRVEAVTQRTAPKALWAGWRGRPDMSACLAAPATGATPARTGRRTAGTWLAGDGLLTPNERVWAVYQGPTPAARFRLSLGGQVLAEAPAQSTAGGARVFAQAPAALPLGNADLTLQVLDAAGAVVGSATKQVMTGSPEAVAAKADEARARREQVASLLRRAEEAGRAAPLQQGALMTADSLIAWAGNQLRSGDWSRASAELDYVLRLLADTEQQLNWALQAKGGE